MARRSRRRAAELACLGVLVSAALPGSAAGQDAQADFDGDGCTDLAVGVPGQDVGGSADAGAVHVFYFEPQSGSCEQAGPEGRFQDNRVLTEDSVGVTGVEVPLEANAGDRFGASLASGNFDGDEFADLAVGAPGQDLAAADAGAVIVFYGAPAGIIIGGSQAFGQSTPIAVEDTAEPGDAFATGLAAGDLGCRGYDALAVSVPYEDRAANNDGVVNVIYGSSAGLRASDTPGDFDRDDQLIGQNDPPEIDGQAEHGDFFGGAVRIGGFVPGECAALAAGVPGEDVGRQGNAGAVNVIYNDGSGLGPERNEIFTQNSFRVPGVAEGAEGGNDLGDLFGFSLASGNFDDFAGQDLAVGVIGEDNDGGDEAGAVNVIYSANPSPAFDSPGGLTGCQCSGVPAPQIWTQDSSDVRGESEDWDRFGFDLAAGQLGARAGDDLAVGAPYEDVDGEGNAGGVNVLPGAADVGLVAKGDQLFTQRTEDMGGAAEAGDRFGMALELGLYGLAVGIPRENVGKIVDAGAVQIIRNFAGLTAEDNQLLDQEQTDPEILDDAQRGDYFGRSLASGD